MNIAIIVAAGAGRRFGGAKQFVELAGKPVVVHAIEKFERAATIDSIIVVASPDAVETFSEIANRYRLMKLARVVAGGETRSESVWRGLQAASESSVEIVAVHDGVRPFVAPSEIDACVNAAREKGAAILASPAVDTIKEVHENRIARTIPRRTLWHALTPQCFRYDILRRAYEAALTDDALREATDDSSLVERLGVSVSIVEGDARRNIKITAPQDLLLAEMMIKER